MLARGSIGAVIALTHGMEAETMTQTIARVFSPSATYYECGICDQWHALEWDGDCRQDSARLNPEDMDEQHGAAGWQAVDMDQVDEVRAAQRQGESPAQGALLQGPWVWRSFGGAIMLVTEHGGSKVVLSAGRGPILTRDVGGQLSPLTEGHPVAKLSAAAPEMAAALREALVLLDAYRVGGCTVEQNHRTTDEMRRVLRKAGVPC